MTLSDRITAIVLMIIGIVLGVLSVFALFVQITLWFGGVENVKVIEWNKKEVDEFVVFSYLNEDGHTYQIKKEVPSRYRNELKQKSFLTIKYSRIYPGKIEIIGAPELDYIYYILGIILMSVLVWRSVRALRGQITMKDFAGFRG
jgi:hypothetical protein